MSVTLQHPFTGYTREVVLPNPELGDVDNHDFGLKIHEAMDGELFTYVDVATKRLLELSFTNVRRTIITSLRSFLDASFAEDIKLIDWLDRVWRGKIITDPITFSIDRGSGACTSISFSLEFEGALQ